MRRLLTVLVPVLAVTLGAASCGSAGIRSSAQPGRPAPSARTSPASSPLRVPASPSSAPQPAHSALPPARRMLVPGMSGADVRRLQLRLAAHGCVRIPMDIAQFFRTRVAVPGEPVYIRR